MNCDSQINHQQYSTIIPNYNIQNHIFTGIIAMKQSSDQQNGSKPSVNQSYGQVESENEQMKKSQSRNRASSSSSLRKKSIDQPLLSQRSDSSGSIKKSVSSNQNQAQQHQQTPLIQRIKQYLFKHNQTCPRVINLQSGCTPPNYQNNIVKNTKYNIITFIPLVLYNQFKFFFNLFFLVTALTQLIQVLRVGLFITFIGPLIMVLMLTMGKQAYDDYRTYLRDIQANSKQYLVVRKKNGDEQIMKGSMSSHGFEEEKNKNYLSVKMKSKDLKVGDIVILKSGDRIPADMITLYSDNDQGTLFLKTDQLDGETDWKLRKAVKITQNLANQNNRDYGLFINSKYQCLAKQPVAQIYNFQGIFSAKKVQKKINQQQQQKVQMVSEKSSGNSKQKLSLENTLWTSTVLTNGQVVGLVIYTGNQTRIALGASTPRTKIGILDMEINFLSKILFLVMSGITVIMLILQSIQIKYIPIQFTRILILLSSIIPISMRVNLDFAKLFYAYQINNDKFIQGTITRNSNCPEELGRVKYILSDKTGTLTQNQMLFRSISIEDSIKFTQENVEQMKEIISQFEQNYGNIHCRQKSLKQIITALAVCHNVTPVYNNDQEEEPAEQKQMMKQSLQSPGMQMPKSSPISNISQTNGKKQFQASSPDEITFVKLVESLGICLRSRTQTTLKLILPSKKELEYQILKSFPFSSETKRMGIIVKNLNTNKITFYLKGADIVMKQFVPNRQKKGFIDQQCRDLSITGLRTLVITKKQLKQQEYRSWIQKYEQAQNCLQVDKKQIEKIMKQLQQGVQFLGVTGIQDKLQKKLKGTIQSLKSAGIKIWMITGDKIETAECISRSCGLQKITEQNIKIQQITNPAQWKNRWQSVKTNLSRVLIIDGKTLSYVVQQASKQIGDDFYKTAMQMPAVICCRCSPQQKRILTQGVKAHRNKNQAVLGIGDGGNDVGMIQAADIGLGIVGKEGKQAALAADFSMLEFRHIKTMLLWHGRLSYKRSALLASFIIHRGFIVSVIQIIFSCIFFYVSIPVFNSVLQLGYATIFTFWPVFSLILDTDIDKSSALKYPALYNSLQSSNQLSITSFVAWLFKAAVQGTLIMILSIVFFQDQTYLELETICFTVLIITQYCMTLSQIHRIHILTIACVVSSIVCYIGCVFFLNDYIHVAELTIKNLAVICLIVAISWGPLLAYKIIRKKLYPDDYEKVMKNVKRSIIGKKLIQYAESEQRDSLIQ